jgi:hypothetical protein
VTQASRLTHERQNAMKLPRDNGELMFHSPWESRVFAMAVLLCEKGEYAWNTFNEQFAKFIGDAEMHSLIRKPLPPTTTTGGKRWRRCFWRKPSCWRSSCKPG